MDGSQPPIRLTDTAEGDTVPISWTPDSEAVLVTQDRDGDERVRIFLVKLSEPGVMEPLTEPEPNYYIGGGQLHPNGRWLIYSANLDAESGEEIEADRLYRHDLSTGERLVLARPEKGSIPHPELNRQGTHVLYESNKLDPAGLQVRLVDIEGNEDREILNFGAKVKVFASWFPDGRRVVFTTEAGTHRRVGVWSLDDESLRWLVDDPERNVGYAFVPPNDGPVVVVGAEQARTKATLLDAESGAETRVRPRSGNLIPLAQAADGGWVGVRYDARHPAVLARFEPSGEETAKSITGFWERTSLVPGSLAPAEDFRWKSVDGLEIQGWLYRASGETRGTIVLVHGGPTSHSEDRFNAQVQYLVARGFDVLSPNYRGSTGFGLEFQEEIKADGWGGREQDDIGCGIEALIGAGISSPGKVGVTGTSYGGYSAWCAITRYSPEIVAAAAPICGMTDLVVDYHSTRPDLRPYSEEMMGGSPDEVPKRYRERSPIHSVENIRGRVLIVQGQRDPNVTPENVSAVTKELDRHGVAYELLAFEDEGHGIARPKNLKILYPRLADFFEAAFGDHQR